MNRISLWIVGLALLNLFLNCHSKDPKSLYSADDPLHELNSTNFQPIVFGKSKAWTIQFYNSWCGHCQRFAPTYKEFARDVETWRSVMDIGVVDCNREDNVQLCRQYGIEVFPTIKHFWVNVSTGDLGELFTSPRDIPSLENSMINFIEANSNKGVPKHWPKLSPLQETDLMTVATSIKGEDIFLFIEDKESFAGRKVILDLSDQKDQRVKRVLSTSKLLDELRSFLTDDSLPALVKLTKDFDKEARIRFFSNKDDIFIRDRVYEEIMNKERVKKLLITTSTENPVSTEPSVDKNLTLLHLTDLENALHNSLYQEVGLIKDFDAERISALKAYLALLKNYFPSTKPVKNFLMRLHDWLSYRTHTVTGEDFIKSMKKLTTDDASLPDMRDWVKCRGSQPKYRGYPCSLWSLFHWLTVQADRDAVEHPGSAMDNGNALFIIRDYVSNFFTCNECKKHFLEMAANVEQEVKSSKDAVLWLWEAHNTVNKRLSGDPTEDPRYPKVQFPSQDDCSSCYKPDGTYDRNAVYLFLQKFYSTKWLRDGDTVEPHQESDHQSAGAEQNQATGGAMGLDSFFSTFFSILPILVNSL